jgi:hypothetical protein
MITDAKGTRVVGHRGVRNVRSEIIGSSTDDSGIVYKALKTSQSERNFTNEEKNQVSKPEKLEKRDPEEEARMLRRHLRSSTLDSGEIKAFLDPSGSPNLNRKMSGRKVTQLMGPEFKEEHMAR